MNTKLSVSEVFQSAWQSFTNNASFLYYLMVPSFALSLVALMVSPEAGFFYATEPQMEAIRMIAFAILSIVGGIAGIFATISILFFVRSNKKDTWKSWNQYWRLLPKYILVCILQGLLILAGLILFIIPGIYLALRYAFVSYRTLEHPTESIKNLFAAEAKATEGNRWTILGIGAAIVVIFIAYTVLSSMLFMSTVNTEGKMIIDFVFQFLATPFFTLVSVFTYTKLTENKAPESEVSAQPEKKEEEAPEVAPVIEPVV